MTYQEQLQQPEWNSKRLEILERDEFKCTNCAEQPKLKGLLKSFGINSLDELRAKGYSLFQPVDGTLTYDNIALVNKNFINTVKFVGDISRNFDITQLRFGLKYWSAETPLGKMEGYELLSFYPETYKAKNLIDLNVHHKYYVIGSKAWEYENSVLTTLCIDCHKSEHERNHISVFSKQGDKLYETILCDKCGGAGYLEEYYYHMNGICFNCCGEGVINIGT